MSSAAQVAVHNLRVDHNTASMLRALSAAGVPSILLKGPSTARWLHPEVPRPYQDTDLLVGPMTLDAAERVLREQGFAPSVERTQMPEWWRDHAVEWTSPDRYSAVDLHHGLKNTSADARLVWEVLVAETETMEVGGFGASVLTAPGRCVVLALDRLGEKTAKSDLDRAIEVADADVWVHASRLASELGVTTEFAAGLRSTAAGAQLADRLALPSAATVELALRAQRSAPGAVTFERFANASTMAQRWSMLRFKLVPPPTYMRQWSRRSRSRPVPLWLGYCRRLWWVATRTPAALRAWRRARRAAQADGSREI